MNLQEKKNSRANSWANPATTIPLPTYPRSANLVGHYCGECIANYQGHGPECPLCRNPVEYIGASNSAKPFWQMGLFYFLYALKPAPLIVLALTAGASLLVSDLKVVAIVVLVVLVALLTLPAYLLLAQVYVDGLNREDLARKLLQFIQQKFLDSPLRSQVDTLWKVLNSTETTN